MGGLPIWFVVWIGFLINRIGEIVVGLLLLISSVFLLKGCG